VKNNSLSRVLIPKIRTRETLKAVEALVSAFKEELARTLGGAGQLRGNAKSDESGWDSQNAMPS
jgi:hypothetical protein